MDTTPAEVLQHFTHDDRVRNEAITTETKCRGAHKSFVELQRNKDESQGNHFADRRLGSERLSGNRNKRGCCNVTQENRLYQAARLLPCA